MLNYLQSVFASFHSHDVRYVVIGGIAAVLHGVPRATCDLDILIEATAPNAERLLQVLREEESCQPVKGDRLYLQRMLDATQKIEITGRRHKSAC